MSQILSTALVGVEALPVHVEADLSFGMSQFNIVGLPDASVREARDRIRAAIRHAGLPFPRTRLTINLAPADLRKQGPLYDLPIALAILCVQGILPWDAARDALFMGELSLEGAVRPVRGALPAALLARARGWNRLFVPARNAKEASCVDGIQAIPVESLPQLVDCLCGRLGIEAASPIQTTEARPTGGADLSHVRGQAHAKRGIEIAAAGGHNLLLSGPPGTGKTLLARCLPSILPELSREEAIEATSIASIAGALDAGAGLVRQRPFRSPHHSSSAASLVGGGSWPKPGEVSLAHRGVLFLDELPEFSRHVLEHLRQPIEDGEVVISRASGSARFPARFLLVATMNPCPCGYASDPRKPCVCSARSISSYRRRISGPLLDRFDLTIEVPNLEASELCARDPDGETSSAVRERVERARAIQSERAGPSAMTNAEIPAGKMDRCILLDEPARRLLETAVDAHGLSARSYARVCKVARTIADLAGTERAGEEHVAEALQYRMRAETK